MRWVHVVVAVVVVVNAAAACVVVVIIIGVAIIIIIVAMRIAFTFGPWLNIEIGLISLSSLIRRKKAHRTGGWKGKLGRLLIYCTILAEGIVRRASRESTAKYIRFERVSERGSVMDQSDPVCQHALSELNCISYLIGFQAEISD